MQHFTVPASTFDEDVFDDGMAFDGSSIRGFQSIHESDMMLLPGPGDRADRPVPQAQDAEPATSSCTTRSPGEPTRRDPRNVARKAEKYLASTGIADTCYFGAEAEFYIFDSVRFDTEHERERSTRSTRSRAGGTPAARRTAATSATRSATRAATSRSRRTTTTPTCATTWPPT